MKRARIALGLFSLLMLVGAALLLGVSHDGTKNARSNFAVKTSGDPDASSKKDSASVEAGPAATTAAAEAIAQRAYPADEIPLQLSLNAQKAWSSVKGRKGKNKAGQWAMVGPSHSNMPGLLVFSGADYTTSGRITALALDPSCSQSKCRLWIGAAGGGVWRTKNAMAGTPSWTPVSDGLPTNAIGALTYDAASDTLYAGTGEPNASADSEAGLGLFKSTDGGDTWTHVAALTTTAISGAWVNKDAFLDRAISPIVVDPDELERHLRASASAIRGVVLRAERLRRRSADSAAALVASTSAPTAARRSRYLNGGSLPFVLRGVIHVVLDPPEPQHRLRVARSARASIARPTAARPGRRSSRASPSGSDRDRARLARRRRRCRTARRGCTSARRRRPHSRRAALPHRRRSAGRPAFTDIDHRAERRNYCTAQCWYDNVVYSPPGRRTRSTSAARTTTTTPARWRSTGHHGRPNAGRFSSRPTRRELQRPDA